MTVLWREFPEINRKVAFSYNFQSSSFSLGCHCGSISGVTATFGDKYNAANDGHNIEVLDTSKEASLVYTKDSYFGSRPSHAENKKIFQYIKDIKLTFEDISSTAYPEIVKICGPRYPLWVMSDVINYEAPARKNPFGDSIYIAVGHTVDFVKYLITNKIGYVMASPIIQNPMHNSKLNYSLNRGWFWIPPDHLSKAINVAEAYGDDQFPSQEAWIERVGKELGIVRPEMVLQTVLDGGVFPSVERRFKQGRDAQGRFLPLPNIKEA